ncbi:outer membrane lipoprotein carrier protein LolA [Parashewanella curva]|uniref:Outer membrane lipoprotein carrier protein LolA n=1 Tax=Parashewanella curva TaxID=2338552 RepID=A0A3L8Q0H8_9GAMM|nr:outer membrane lipoprotein carrier protein LolA [Parashewanella curva]RLV60529.1 outer membrane lipoprotein carrier protein LolA [Parashewanella curva]
MKIRNSLSKIFIFTLVALLSGRALACENLFSHPITASELKQMSKLLVNSNPLQTQFEQTRKLAILKRPLKSSGRVSFSPKRGVIWQQQKPFKTTLILQANSLTQVNSQGQVSVITGGESNTISELLSPVMNGMFTGNIAALQESFDLYFQNDVDKEYWLLGLIPKNNLAKKAFSSIVIRGDNIATKSEFSIQTIVLTSNAIKNKKSDVTTIRFIEPQTHSLGKNDLQLFELSSSNSVL